MKNTIITTSLVAGALAGTFALASAASASHGGGNAAVRKTVACSTGSLQLKAKPDDPTVLEVEAELDTNRVGQVWKWTITDNGKPVGSGTSTTAAPSGSFGVRRVIADAAGTDTIRFAATMPSTGAACAVSVTL